MREIKFRAWDKSEKVMLVSNPFSSFFGCDSSDGKKNRHDKRSMMTWDGHCYIEGKLQDYILLQFTGLKDKNGVEIYEGDLIDWLDNTDAPFEIAWSPDTLSFARKFEGKYLFFNSSFSDSVEVIGNIYQNPELAKQ